MFGKHCNNLSVHDCSCVLGGHRLRDRPGFSQQVHLSRTPRMTWQGSRKVRWTCSLSPWLYSKPIPTYSQCGRSVTPFAVECLLIKLWNTHAFSDGRTQTYNIVLHVSISISYSPYMVTNIIKHVFPCIVFNFFLYFFFFNISLPLHLYSWTNCNMTRFLLLDQKYIFLIIIHFITCSYSVTYNSFMCAKKSIKHKLLILFRK